ncbi:MAG TPA: uroporphyrinogen-III synthase [Flavisolibacter sp.]|nr:uroporphyrinogen-III synthase [Flavisolibacter sp.]
MSTRQLDPSLVELAKQQGIEITEIEFISIHPISTEDKLKEVQAWAMAAESYAAFTSAHAVTSVDKFLHQHHTVLATDWKIFCLQGRTKQAIMNAAVLNRDIVGEAANATSLARLIVSKGVKEIIFFCGDKRRDELPDTLKKQGVMVHEVVVYETRERPAEIRDGFDAVLFFSPSAVESFFSRNQLPARTVCFAIGDTTAQSISKHTANKVLTSGIPEQEAVVNLAASYLNSNEFKNI